MEEKFDLIKPNLCVSGDNIYFGIEPQEVVSVSKSIDGIVKRNIGELKVKKSDLETAQAGQSMDKPRQKKHWS
jgi:hypothetical protein